jgi:hypothetical protein
MSEVMSLAGVPIAVGLSVVFAVGVELALIGGFIRLMARAAAQLEEDCPGGKSRKSPARS